MNAEAAGAGLAWSQLLPWLFDANPWQTGQFGEIYEDGRTLLGHAVEFPQPLWLDGASTVGWMHMSVWLHPSVRGSFAGVQIYKRFLSRHRNELCATTTANGTSAAVWEKLRGVPQRGTDVALLKVLRPGRVVLAAVEHWLRGGSRRVPWVWTPAETANRSAGPFLSGRPASLAELEACWRRNAHRYVLATDRTEAWFAWRYGADAPESQLVALSGADGEVVAFYAYKLSRRGGTFATTVATVLDLVADTAKPEVMNAVLRDLVARASAEGADLVEMKGGANDVRVWFEAVGFRPRRGANPGYWIRLPKTHRSLASAPERFNLVPGDGDAGYR